MVCHLKERRFVSIRAIRVRYILLYHSFNIRYKNTKNNRDSQEKSRQNSHYCYLLFQIVSERFSASFGCRNFAE